MNPFTIRNSPITILLLVLFLLSFHEDATKYLTRIHAEKLWSKEKVMIDMTGIDYREIDQFTEKYPIMHENPNFILDYGQLLKRKGKYTESISILSDGVKRRGLPIFYLLIGENYEKMNMYIQAEYYYKRAFDILPNRLYPLYKLCLLYNNISNDVKLDSLSIQLLDFTPKTESSITDFMKADMYEILGLDSLSIIMK